MSKILVTGATGYIGRFTSKYLHSQGHHVWAVLHDRSRQVLLPQSVIPTSLQEAKEHQDWDVIIHLAYGFDRGWRRTLRLNMTLAQEVMEIGRHSKAKVIYASSIAVLGYCPKSVSRAQLELNHVCQEDVYTYVKGQLERYILKYARREDFPIYIIRIGNVMGPGSAWTSLLLDRLYSDMLGIDLDAYSNATSIFNLVSLIVDELLVSNDVFRIVLSTEFSTVTWGKWLYLILGDSYKSILRKIASKPRSIQRSYMNHIMRSLRTSRVLRRIIDVLPERCYQALKRHFGGPRLEPSSYCNSIDEVQQKVFSCRQAWPSHGSMKYTLEETCESIREWAKEAGYLLWLS